LSALKIKIKAEDVGLNYGRTIVFDPKTKELSVIKAGRQTRII
jgi:chemotaxis protein CheD